jgi:hypothetical protein
MWITEVDVDIGCHGDVFPVAHLYALIPGERPTQHLGQRLYFLGQGVTDLLGFEAVGRWRSIVQPVVRSTSDPIAEALHVPMMRSPSQCPGTARSAASAGPSLMLTMSGSTWSSAVTGTVVPGFRLIHFRLRLG